MANQQKNSKKNMKTLILPPTPDFTNTWGFGFFLSLVLNPEP
jgi:hypothetical protein